VIAPYRVTQIQGARIGRATYHCAADRTSGRAQCRITCSSTDGSTAGRTKQCAAGSAITRVGTATRDEQGRRKPQHHSRAHVWLLISCGIENASRKGAVPAATFVFRTWRKVMDFLGVATAPDHIAVWQYWGEMAAVVAARDIRRP
jgi:hypothetical protein